MTALITRPTPAALLFGLQRALGSAGARARGCWPRSPLKHTARAVTLLAALAAPGLVHAVTQVTAQLGVLPSFAGGAGPLSLLKSDTFFASASGSGSGGADSSGEGSVWVQHGIIKVEGDFGGSGYTISRGIFRDGLTLVVPGLARGTPVDVTFEIEVRGDLQVSPTTGGAAARWALQADFGGGAFDLRRQAELRNSGVGGAPVMTGSPFGIFETTVRLAVGFEAPLYVELEGTALAAYTGSFVRNSASFDLSQSLYWGGITQVSAAGQNLTDYSVASTSGTDYRFSLAPVPEPGGVALMLAGLAALGGLQRARTVRGRAR